MIETSQHTSWIKPLIFTCVILIILGLLFRTLTPQSHPAQELTLVNYDRSTSEFNNVVFTGEPIVPPQNLPIAAGETSLIDHETIVQRFTEQFDLTASATSEGLYVSDDHQLSYSEQIEMYTYSLLNKTTSTSKMNPTQALNVARQFVEQFLPEQNITLAENSVGYYLDSTHVIGSTASEANLMNFVFTTQILDIPVLEGISTKSGASIWVNNNNQITKADFIPTIIEYEVGRRYETISVYQAVENINTNNASITKTFFLDVGLPNIEEIKSGTLTTVRLYYRLEETSGSIIPYYEFYGTLVTGAGESIEATIITPAIVTDFSQQIE